MAQQNQHSMFEDTLEPVKKQYEAAREWIDGRSAAQLIMLILLPILVLSVVGFILYRMQTQGGGVRSASRTKSRRTRSRATASRRGSRTRTSRTRSRRAGGPRARAPSTVTPTGGGTPGV